jgi:hypothetical protein
MSETLFKTVIKKPTVTPDGTEHATLEDAQKHLLAAFFAKSSTIQRCDGESVASNGLSASLAAHVVDNKADFLAIIGKQPRKARAPKASASAPVAVKATKK